MNARQAGEAGGPWMSVQDWERLQRDDGATLQNQEWLEAQRRDAEIRREAAEEQAAELGRQLSQAQERVAGLEERVRGAEAEVGQLGQQLKDALEELSRGQEGARQAEEDAAETRDEVDRALWRLELTQRELE